MSKIDELLSVLDMPLVEQCEWLIKEKIIGIGAFVFGDKAFRACLADLGFRLRNEAVNTNKTNWGRAVLKVNIKCASDKDYECWWQNHSQSIHWIVAALIAKELVKEQENGKD